MDPSLRKAQRGSARAWTRNLLETRLPILWHVIGPEAVVSWAIDRPRHAGRAGANRCNQVVSGRAPCHIRARLNRSRSCGHKVERRRAPTIRCRQRPTRQVACQLFTHRM